MVDSDAINRCLPVEEMCACLWLWLCRLHVVYSATGSVSSRSASESKSWLLLFTCGLLLVVGGLSRLSAASDPSLPTLVCLSLRFAASAAILSHFDVHVATMAINDTTKYLRRTTREGKQSKCHQ